MNEKSARIGLGIVLPVVAGVLAYLPYVVHRDELPDRFATHFGSDGPDGSMTPTGFLITTGVFIAIGMLGMMSVALKRAPLHPMLAWLGGILGGFFVGLFGGIFALTVLAQHDLADWREASGSGWLVLGSLTAALTFAGAAGWLTSRLPIQQPDPADASAAPTMPLEDSEHAVWSTRLHNRWLLLLGIGALVLGIVYAVLIHWLVILPTAISALAVLSFATLNVRADRHGLHVRYGILPWPRTHIKIGQIRTASVADIRPKDWGGWGYRGSLKLMNQAAVVHRAGPGIRLDLSEGKIFAVTVDDPQTPAALLNAEVARQVSNI